MKCVFCGGLLPSDHSCCDSALINHLNEVLKYHLLCAEGGLCTEAVNLLSGVRKRVEYRQNIREVKLTWTLDEETWAAFEEYSRIAGTNPNAETEPE